MIVAIRILWVLFTSLVKLSTIGVATAIIETLFDRIEDLIDRYIATKSQPIVIIQ